MIVRRLAVAALLLLAATPRISALHAQSPARHGRLHTAPAHRQAVDSTAPAPANDGDRPRAWMDRRGASALEVWGGLATDSPELGILGDTPRQNLGLLALRWSRRLSARGEAIALEQTVDIVPIALITPPLQHRAPAPGARQCDADSGCRTLHVTTPSETFPPGSVYGAGISPVGLTVTLAPARPVQASLGVSGGALWFTRPVPTSLSTHFNFTATAEAGLSLIGRSGRGASITYRFHHLSNAGLGQVNYGVASHLLAVGIRWRR